MELTRGQKIHQTLLTEYGPEWLTERSAKGGRVKVPKGFAKATPEQRSAWGRLGGVKSKRPKKEVSNE